MTNHILMREKVSMKIRKEGDKFFGDEYKERVTNKEHKEKHLVGDIAKEFDKQYVAELNDIVQKHIRLDGIYYIYVLHSKDPQFPTAHKICFCSLRPKDLHKALMIPSADLWKVDNSIGLLELQWAIPPKGKIPRVLSKPTDEKTYKWTKQALKGEKWQKI